MYNSSMKINSSGSARSVASSLVSTPVNGGKFIHASSPCLYTLIVSHLPHSHPFYTFVSIYPLYILLLFPVYCLFAMDMCILTLSASSIIRSTTGIITHGRKLRRPWTDRVDLGINSRIPTGRGDEVYFLGVIDILQQYNVQKRFETMVKVCF